jgi:nucleoside-diphosphate-sugar epimerase
MVEILHLPHEIQDIPNATALKVDKGLIEFKDVSFAFGGNKPVFNKLNLFIKAGEKVALIGSSGAGKSTLVKLLLRLNDLQGGEISIDGQNIKNVSTTGPRAVYDEAKRFGETITSYFWRDKGVDARIVRIFNTYGPNMHKDDLRMISRFIAQALANEPITIFGDGSQTRSLCYIDDLIEGLSRLMFYNNTKGEVVNLGNPEEHTVFEYAEMVKKITGSTSEIVHTEDLPKDDPLRRCPDIEKAKNLLSWEPKVSLEDGLMKMIEYVKNM